MNRDSLTLVLSISIPQPPPVLLVGNMLGLGIRKRTSSARSPRFLLGEFFRSSSPDLAPIWQ